MSSARNLRSSRSKKISHSDVPDAPWYTLVHSSTLWYTLVDLSTLWNILVFVQTVHMNFHAKSGLCSSRNERVMLNFVIWRPFCFLVAILFFLKSKFVQTVHRNFHEKSGEIWTFSLFSFSFEYKF